MPNLGRDVLVVRDMGGRELARLTIPGYPHRNEVALHLGCEGDPAMVVDFGRVGTRTVTINTMRPNADGTRTNVHGVMRG